MVTQEDIGQVFIVAGIAFTFGVLLMYFTIILPRESLNHYWLHCGIENCELKELPNYNLDSMNSCLQYMLKNCDYRNLTIRNA